ncbi:MAG: hypothetical protein PHY92_05470 [Alphaproteobacteria bacterium]|nr:hypothetical protein [Alphaproteobacteria bacterium]
MSDDIVLLIDGLHANLKRRYHWHGFYSEVREYFKQGPESDPVQKRIIINRLLPTFAVLAKRDLDAPGILGMDAIRFVKGDPLPISQILGTVLPLCPEEALISTVAFSPPFKKKDFSNLKGITFSGSDQFTFAISPPGGSIGRVSFALQKFNRPVEFVVGCFTGSGEELLDQARLVHEYSPGIVQHYQTFVDTAQKTALRHERLLPLNEVIHQRLLKVLAKKGLPQLVCTP